MTQEERTRISRELIIKGAIREFSRHGYENASINRLCTDNGISKGRLFHHFQNKDEIYTVAVQDCYEALCRHTAAFRPSPDCSLETNFHMYFAYRQQFFLEQKYGALLMYQAIQQPPEILKAEIGKIREQFAACNLAVLKDIFEHSTQEIICADQRLAMQAFHVASYFIHLHVGYPNWNPEKDMRPVTEHSLEVFDQIVRMLLYGILPRRDGPSTPLESDLIDRSLARAAETQQNPAAEGGAQEEDLT